MQMHFDYHVFFQKHARISPVTREQWDNKHVIWRCCSVGRFESFDSMKQDFRFARKVIGAEGVACHATTCCKTDYSLSTCKYQSPRDPSLVGIMQRCHLRGPWKNRTLLIAQAEASLGSKAKCASDLSKALNGFVQGD